ncbi:MAG TPA: hypothetical protein PKC14_02230 [Candidatus Absconditabacterales bacterium]|nr:hypothetical protein [Candidatus Absconditabacterales bacterium]
MQKKILSIFSFGLLFFGFSSANCISFDAGNVCLYVNKYGSNYTVSNTITNANNSLLALTCDVLTPDGTIQSLGACNGSFTYSNGGVRNLKFYVRLENQYLAREFSYDFTNGGALNPIGSNNNNNNNNNYTNNFLVTLSASSVSKNQYISTTLYAQSNGSTNSSYQGTANITVQKLQNGYRSTANSYDYYLNPTSTYFSSNNYGYKNLSNNIIFYNDGTYRLFVTDSSNSSIQGYSSQITVSTNSSTTTPYFQISLPTTVTKNTSVAGSIQVYNSSNYYQGITNRTIEKLQNGYRSTASSYDYTILASSPLYFYTRENNQKNNLSMIKFLNSGTYRVILKDQSNSSIQGTSSNITVQENSSYYTTSLEVSPSNYSPATSNYVNLTLKAYQNGSILSSYTNTVSLRIEKYTNGYRYTANSSEYSLSPSSTSFSSRDYGQKTLSNAVIFYSAGTYRVVATDQNNIQGISSNINVGGNSSYYTTSLEVSPSNYSPRTSNYINLTLKAYQNGSILSSYTNTVSLRVEKYTNGYRWTANSSEYSLSPSSTSFSSRDYGQKTLSNAVIFYSVGTYRIVAADQNNISTNSSSIVVSNTTSNNSSAGFSSYEMRQVKSAYDIRPALINQLKIQYPRLSTNSSWLSQQQTLYQDMTDILNNALGKRFTSYQAFYNELVRFVQYTIQVR